MPEPAPPVAYLLDLDGTLYASGAAVPGAPETLRRLREAGRPFRLVTNTTSRPRAMLVERLRGYGFAVEPEEIFTATLAGAALARDAGHQVLAPFLPAPAHEDLAGFELVGGLSSRRGQPQAVILGDLGEAWTYALLQEAFEYVMDGAAMIALSRDRYWQRDDRLALDAGPFVRGLEYATGVEARVAGKPSPGFYAAALASLGLEAPAPAVMVGDDLWSDIEGAQRAGLQGWLVRTGKFREDTLRDSGITPDRVLPSVTALVPA
ncbi:MAG TPA: TIGR01458 family HAD-type hydrolase [Gemmatimonadales bacterium]|nr:TIGR01458 family HAD-type hydrolase [Gemmatimonadales bacterium]